MTPETPSVRTEPTALQLAAMTTFARDGYSGASMRAIAAAAGIRASSVYSHFAGKDDLFLSLLDIAEEAEAEFAASYFAAADAGCAEEILAGYLTAVSRRADEEISTRFLLTVKFFPPQIHRQAVDDIVVRLADALTAATTEAVRRCGRCRMAPEAFALSYLALLESLECELIYTNHERWAERYEAVRALMRLAFEQRPSA